MEGVDKMSFIEVKNISKTFKVPIKQGILKDFFNRKYRYIKAIDNISFSIKKGEIVGYIGPNGAGKSTTIKILSGILHPDSGKVVIDKKVPYEERIKYVKEIGVVFGQRSQLWWDVPAIDSFSLGSRMKLEIAASLIHKPKILFLDEPTIGLDAISKKDVREFIKKINKKNNITIILTTHDMNDIEALAKRIILIGKGKKLYDGTLNELKKDYGYIRTISVKTKDKINIKKNYIVSQKKNDDTIEFKIDTRKIELNKFINNLTNNISIIDLEIDDNNMDDIVVKLYEDFNIW